MEIFLIEISYLVEELGSEVAGSELHFSGRIRTDPKLRSGNITLMLALFLHVLRDCVATPCCDNRVDDLDYRINTMNSVRSDYTLSSRQFLVIESMTYAVTTSPCLNILAKASTLGKPSNLQIDV
jgi:UDP-N-acetyl-D-mannosaminuronate dehydrogenase